MTYSLDFRIHVLKIKTEEGLSYEETSRRFKVGKASLVRWNIEIQPKMSRNKPATKIDMDQLKKDIITYPDSYYYERATRLGVSKNGIYWAMKRLGVTYKKNTESSKSRRRTAISFSTTDPEI